MNNFDTRNILKVNCIEQALKTLYNSLTFYTTINLINYFR